MCILVQVSMETKKVNSPVIRTVHCELPGVGEQQDSKLLSHPSNHCLIPFCFLCVILGTELSALSMVGKYSTTELSPRPSYF